MLYFTRVEIKEDWFIAIICLCWVIWSFIVYKTINRKKMQNNAIKTYFANSKFYVGIVILLFVTTFLSYEET